MKAMKNHAIHNTNKTIFLHDLIDQDFEMMSFVHFIKSAPIIIFTSFWLYCGISSFSVDG